jgi:hypothetical protein
MKQGHIRLEADKWFSLPLTMKPGQNYSLKITPSKLSGEKKTGFELKTDTRKSSIAFVKTGNLLIGIMAQMLTMQRVIDGRSGKK